MIYRDICLGASNNSITVACHAFLKRIARLENNSVVLTNSITLSSFLNDSY